MRVDYDEDGRWIVMYRGSLAIACNLGTDVVDVPVTGELALTWGEPKVDAETTRLEGHSFAVLRRVSG
jgi:maltooligosyltrehalose trehalohydrolase